MYKHKHKHTYKHTHKYVYTHKGSDTMTKEPIFQSNLTQEEVEKNFEDFDVFAGLLAGLQEADRKSVV